MISKKDKIYIAGFFDGEGCILSTIKSFTKYPSIKIQITQKFPTILHWIQRTTNLGRITQNSTSSLHIYVVSGKKNVLRFIKLILPYSIVKRQQLLLGLELAELIMPHGGNPKKVTEINYNRRMQLYTELKRLKRCD